MKTFAFYFFLSSPLMALIAAPSVSVVPAFIHVHWAHRQGKRLQIRLNKCGVNGNNNNNTTVRAVILRKLCFIKNLCADRCTVLRETSLFFPSSRQPPFSNGVAYLLTVNSPSPFSIQVFPRILVHPGFENEWKKKCRTDSRENSCHVRQTRLHSPTKRLAVRYTYKLWTRQNREDGNFLPAILIFNMYLMEIK